MKVLLVGPNFEENLSLRYLSSSLLAAGHEVELAAFNTAADAASVIQSARGVDLVGLSLCFQARVREYLELARELKSAEPSRLVILGGHYASCAAGPLLEHHHEIDLIVIHEGEETLVEIAGAGKNLQDHLPSIRGVAYRREGGPSFTPPRSIVEDLDHLPPPDRRGPIPFIAGVPTASILGSRGCLGSCDYCSITTLHRLAPGKRFRQRDPERIAAEMASLYHGRGIRQFVFHDDNFLVPSQAKNHQRLAALEQALERRQVSDIALATKCRPADLSPSVLGRLRDLGLLRLFLGVESSTEDGLACLNRRQSVADSEKALDLCGERGVSAQYTIMIFNPEATFQTMRADLAFMRRHIEHPLNFCRAEIYAGTPLERRLIAEGRARGDYLGRAYDLLDPSADLACRLAMRIFFERCWQTRSLMELAIGLEHSATALTHFYRGKRARDLARGIQKWQLEVNRNTLDLLEHLVELCAAAPSQTDRGFLRAARELVALEQTTREDLLRQHGAFRAGVDALTAEQLGLIDGERRHAVASSPTLSALARHAAAALFALGLSCSSEVAICEYAPPPLVDTDGDRLPDECERTIFGTDPLKPDSDGDGIPDGLEDHDGDGLSNEQEQSYFSDWTRSCGDLQPDGGLQRDAGRDSRGDVLRDVLRGDSTTDVHKDAKRASGLDQAVSAKDLKSK